MVGTTEALNQIQDIDYYISMIIRRYEDNVEDSVGLNTVLVAYIADIAQSIVNTTFSEMGTERALSEDRAFDIAVNESNTIIGNDEYEQAIKSGKTKKQWITEKDSKVRDTHAMVDDTVVPIQEYFSVGDCVMLYPHDGINGAPEEIVNCRCHVRYL